MCNYSYNARACAATPTLSPPHIRTHLPTPLPLPQYHQGQGDMGNANPGPNPNANLNPTPIPIPPESQGDMGEVIMGWRGRGRPWGHGEG